jgi:hypothetical protein
VYDRAQRPKAAEWEAAVDRRKAVSWYRSEVQRAAGQRRPWYKQRGAQQRYADGNARRFSNKTEKILKRRRQLISRRSVGIYHRFGRAIIGDARRLGGCDGRRLSVLQGSIDTGARRGERITKNNSRQGGTRRQQEQRQLGVCRSVWCDSVRER